VVFSKTEQATSPTFSSPEHPMSPLPLSLLLIIAADEKGCDLDSHAGWMLGTTTLWKTQLADSVKAAGSVRELRSRVAKGRFISATFTDKEGTRTVLEFDSRGRYTRIETESSYRGPKAGGWFEWAWDDSNALLVSSGESWGSISLTGLPDGCKRVYALTSGRYLHDTCVVQGDRLHCSGEYAADYQIVPDGLKDKAGAWFVRRDASGRLLAESNGTNYTATAKKVEGRRSQESKLSVSLDANGLPSTIVDGTTFRVEWTKGALVRVVDGTCPSKTECKNPAVKATVQTLLTMGSPRFFVDEGEPASKARTSTEVWWQKSADRELVERVRAGLSVAADNVKEWTWGGPFDVLVVVGPPTNAE
jgi:hypothetical protein